MRFISWIITLPILIVAMLFAISNRQMVTLELWPLPFSLEAPVFFATLVALLTGFLAGGFIAWNAGRRHRRSARLHGDRAYRLERELKEARTRAVAAEKRVAELTRPVSGQSPRVPPAPGLAAPGLPAPGLAALPGNGQRAA